MPKVGCYPGQLNQGCMNLLANGIDAWEYAIENEVMAQKSPTIGIRTEVNRGIVNQRFPGIFQGEYLRVKMAIESPKQVAIGL